MQNIWSPDTYIKAYRFAAEAHFGQLLPGTELPYMLHVSLVSMEIMAALQYGDGYDGDLAIGCAVLHDALEDTPTTYEQLQHHFGPRVAHGVLALTKDKTLPKEHQMRDSIRRILQQPREVGMVKLADRITNLQPPPSYWTQAKIRQYREEALEIYAALKGAHAGLAARLLAKIESYQAFLE